jgi:hypothetical protein
MRMSQTLSGRPASRMPQCPVQEICSRKSEVD